MVNSSSSPFSSLLFCTFIGCLIDDDFILFLHFVFFISGFIFTFYATCVFIWIGFRCWRELLFCRRFLSFVSCGSGGGIDMITNTFLAQSFLTFILRVGVCVIAYGFVEAR